MKTTLFATIALAMATMPLTFAQGTKPAAPATTSSFAGKQAAKSTKMKSTKVRVKKSTKTAAVHASHKTAATTNLTPVKK